MSFTTPYTNGMRLGQGFNSFTREVCIDDAVLFEPENTPSHQVTHPQPTPSQPATVVPTTTAAGVDTSISTPGTTNTTQPLADQVNQTVVFSSQKVTHLADVLTTLNISAYLSIKYGSIKGNSSAAYINEKKFNESDLNYLVSVKVVNESSRKPPRMRFNSIEGVRPADFTAVFGDFFIADFLEGGEFSALIMVNSGANSDTKSVQEAVEAQLQTGIPGLSAGGGQSVNRKKSDVLSDCEITISVSWTGGGNIREGKQNWTIEEVINVANMFPNLVALNSQRTSAVLLSYNALRTFQIAQAPLTEKMLLKDYSACHIYTKDLFSAYMAYKGIWDEITTMLGSPDEYQAKDFEVDGKKPVQTDPISLNLARMECRDQMARIVTEVDSLRFHPEKALMPYPEILDAAVIVDGAVTQGGVYSAYKFPALLQARLPRWQQAPMSSSDDLWKDGNWTGDEMAAIMKFTADKEHLHFSPPVGDLPKDKRGKAFCSVTTTTSKTQSIPKLVQLAIHGHKHQFGDDLLRASFKQFSVRSRGAVSHIGLVTSETPAPAAGSRHSTSTRPAPCKCTTHYGAASPCPGTGFYNSADVSRGIVKVDIGYVPGSGRIGSLKFYDKADRSLLSWDMYNCVAAGWKPDERVKMEIKTVKPPGPDRFDSMADDPGDWPAEGDTEQVQPRSIGIGNGNVNGDEKVGWELAGVWGRADLVVQNIGMIWRRV